MKALAGVLSFDAGEVEVFGVRLDSEAAAERIKGRIGFMPQGLGLNVYPELTVEENIDFFARLRLVQAAPLAARKQPLLGMTRLEKFRDRPMKYLSGGMKQKLGLICTLIHAPELVILDEPTTGVDPVSRREFWTILAQLVHQRGMTALVSTAYMDEASRFQRMSLLFGGRVLASSAPDVLLAMVPGHEVMVRAEPQVEAMRLLQTRFPHVEARGSWLHTFVERADAEVAASQVTSTLSRVQVHDLALKAPDLEDGCIALLRQQQMGQHAAAVYSSAPPACGPQRQARIAIEALQLTWDFGAFRAVDGVSFRVQ
jgi:ABC-2 type transport system ATP-binding protein